jgi:phage host-nuclease inhibitor protein Gam
MTTMKNRTPVIASLTSYEDVEHKLLEFAGLESKIAEAEARMNSEIQDIRDDYETKTSEARARKEMIEKQILTFCDANKLDFEKVRSRDMVHGTVGFRTNPKKVSLLNRKYNWETVIQLLKKFKWGKDYLREITEVDKEAIIAATSGDDPILSDNKLAAVGVKVDQGETFYLEIKWDSIDSEAA